MRDYRKLTAFQRADALVVAIYRWSDVFPSDERFGLRSQIRRSAISVSANIVEGSARTGEGEYVNHLNIALGSAAELRYLVDLAGRLYPALAKSGNQLPDQTGEVVRILAGLIDSFMRQA
jgi:four helix bundle protein